ncbi:MAG: radical SAM/SPASM domain-containing protein [Myxococcota bacterium]|nr:radical SAM/SPASM domain-containing protein [Myxococcota bacterium]
MTIEYPRLVSVETTNRCNAKCSFCPNNALKRERKVMDEDLFKKIVDDCAGFPLRFIEPFLQGEPFVDPRIFDRLDYINTKLPNTALQLYSNGAALSPKKSDELRSFKVSKLFISLNTIDRLRYERVVGLSFNKTMNNLRYLSGPNPKGPVADKIVVRLTLTEESSAKEISDFKKLCAKLGVKPMTVGLFNYKGDIHSSLPVPRYPCEHIERLDILSNGETTLCCMDQEGAYGWGSVIENSVLEVFNNNKATKVKEMHRRGYRDRTEPCDRCNLFWPSLSNLPFRMRIRHTAAYLLYLAKNRPLWPKLK